MNKSTKKLTKSESIIKRLKKGLGLKTDKSLCEKLEIGTTTLAGWKSRDSVVWETIFTKCEDLSIHWIVTGEGPMRLDETSAKGYDTSDSKTLYNGETEDNVDYWKERCLQLHEKNSCLQDENIRLRALVGEPESLVGKRRRQGRQ